MKRLIILLTISFLPIYLFSQINQTITIGFYNTENLYDTINDPKTSDDEFTPEGSKKWDSVRYFKKLENISKVVSSVNDNQLPDLFGFAEIENRQVLNDLISTQALSKIHYKIVHEESPDSRGIDVGLIYNPDVFKYISHKKIPIPLETEYKVRDILFTKGLLDKDTLYVFVNHWKSRSGGEAETEQQRIQCALTLRNAVDSIMQINNNAKIIIMGDLNDGPQNKSVKETLKADNSGNIGTLVDLMLPIAESGFGTHFYRGEWNALDHIIVSQSLINSKDGYIVKDNKAYVFSPDWISYENKNGQKSPNRTYGGDNYFGGYSDHYPVYTILERVQ